MVFGGTVLPPERNTLSAVFVGAIWLFHEVSPPPFVAGWPLFPFKQPAKQGRVRNVPVSNTRSVSELLFDPGARLLVFEHGHDWLMVLCHCEADGRESNSFAWERMERLVFLVSLQDRQLKWFPRKTLSLNCI